MSKSFGEIFTLVKKAKATEKPAILKAHAGRQLYYFLWVALSGQVNWLLPEGKPDIKSARGRSARANRPGAAPSELAFELRRFYVFLETVQGEGQPGIPAAGVTQARREKMFADILESLSPDEVDLLVAVKDGTFEKEYKLPKKIVDETFPGLLSEVPATVRFIKP